MAQADIWMPLYIGDYLSSTSRLSTEQHGAYLLLIMDYWKAGPPPDNDQILMQITRCSEHSWSIARPMLEGFFVIDGGFWHHKRIDRELAVAHSKGRTASAKAKAAAEARWSKHTPSNAPSNAPSIQQAMLEQCPLPSPSQLHTKPPPNPPKGGRKRSDYSQAFEAFWTIYPNRQGKANAWKSWQKIGAEEREIVMADVINRSASHWPWIKDGGAYVPHASSYLNQRRWEDDIQEQSREARQQDQPRIGSAERSRLAIEEVRRREGRG